MCIRPVVHLSTRVSQDTNEDGSSLVERDALEGLAAVAAGVLHRGARRLRPGVDQQVPPQVVLAGEEPYGKFNP